MKSLIIALLVSLGLTTTASADEFTYDTELPIYCVYDESNYLKFLKQEGYEILSRLESASTYTDTWVNLKNNQWILAAGDESHNQLCILASGTGAYLVRTD